MHCESMVRWLDLVPPPTGILTLRQLANPAGFLVLPANNGVHRTGGRRLFSWLEASARPIAAPWATDVLHVSLPPAGDSRRWHHVAPRSLPLVPLSAPRLACLPSGSHSVLRHCDRRRTSVPANICRLDGDACSLRQHHSTNSGCQQQHGR